MTDGKNSRGVLRMAALGLVLVLSAYWAGSRWGQRQPERVEAVPAAFPEAKPTDLVGEGDNQRENLQPGCSIRRQHRDAQPRV